MAARQHDEHGESAAPRVFEELYERWSEPIYRYLVHLAGRDGGAEDLFQDTWMKAIEHNGMLRNPESFGPWIYRIARNLAYNKARTRKRKGQVWVVSNLAGSDETLMEDLIAQQPDAAPGPRDNAITAERRRIIQDAIAELDPQTQEMLQLRYFEGLALMEVAMVLDVPLGTVCTKVHRALRSVRHTLERQGFAGIAKM